MSFLTLVISTLAFTLSASAGLGGSLILVPAMCVLYGTKQGIALAALLLALNNVGKVVVYRDAIALGLVARLLLLTAAGSALGAGVLVSVPESWVSAAVAAAIGTTFLFERSGELRCRRALAPLFAGAAGAVSGLSGMSGPLKGVALRCLELDRRRFVGAASAVSLAGDTIKVSVFTNAHLLDRSVLPVVLAAVALVPLAAWTGRLLNSRIGERGYAVLFWTVMVGYSIRLLGVL